MYSKELLQTYTKHHYSEWCITLCLLYKPLPAGSVAFLPQDSVLHRTHGSCSHIWSGVCTQSAYQVKLQPVLESSLQPHQADDFNLLMLRSLDKVHLLHSKAYII